MMEELEPAFRAIAEVVVNRRLRRAFEDPEVDPESVARLLEDTDHWDLQLDVRGLAFTLEKALGQVARRLREEPRDQDRLDRLEALVALADRLPFPVSTWEAQNHFWAVKEEELPRYRRDVETGADGREELDLWLARFEAVAEQLRVRLDPSEVAV